MSKSIRSFFVSKTTDTISDAAEPTIKRSKKEHVGVAAVASESSELDSTLLPVPVAEVKPSSTNAPETEEPVDDTKLGWLPFDAMEPGWKASLAPEFNKPYFKNLLMFLNAESKSQTIFPPTMEIFTALNLCPLDKVKVIIRVNRPRTTLIVIFLLYV